VRRFFALGLLSALAQGFLLALTPQEIERRIDTLLAKMTLAEKLGQLSQAPFPPGLPENAKEEIRKGRWSSFFNAGTPAEKAEAQRIAKKESRLGIPLLYAQDAIHGYRTVFPIPLAQASSWNTQLVRQAARATAEEVAAQGVHWTFAPMIDIARDPRWGRIAESLGEDPYLTSALGVAMIQGFQGDSLEAAAAIAACAKHYAGYGAAEAGRDYNTTWIPENLLRDVYLKPFEAARQAGVATFMTSFNSINGVPATANMFTLRKVLRNEWKFDGMVVSDYTAIPELIEHNYAADITDAAFRALRAGVDMEMVSTAYHDQAKSLLDSGRLDPKLIDEAVRNVLRLKFRLGLFGDRPVPPEPPLPERMEVAKRLAAESSVLLKNDGVLPLTSPRKIAVIGPLADSQKDQLGTWAMGADEAAVQTPLAALRKMLGDERVLYVKALKNSRDASHDGFAAAISAARSADVVVLFLGEEEILSGEAKSRAFLDLPGAQEALVAELAAIGKPLVLVMMAGRPLTFQSSAAKANAVLWTWHPGTMGGPAIADLLTGRIVPSGKLPVTFPRTVGQVPIYYARLNTGRPASEKELGIPLGNPLNPEGYTSKYIDVDFTPEYPFGFGLSYTQFEYTNLRLSTQKLPANGSLQVSADIRNSGKVAADEVVQLYTRQLAGSVSRPVRELRAFQKIHVQPGETKTVQFSLPASELAFYNEMMERKTEPGRYQVWVVPNSAGGAQAEFEVVATP
jgi:beta-glucosidase